MVMYFQELGALEAHFPCRYKEGIKTYQEQSEHLEYTLWQPFKMK